MPVVHTSISLPAETLAQLQAVCDTTGQSRAAVLRRLIAAEAAAVLGSEAPPGPPPVRLGRPPQPSANAR